MNTCAMLPHREDGNAVAIDLITEHIRGKLQQHDLRRIFHNLEVIPSNFQTRGMHTIVRSRSAAQRLALAVNLVIVPHA